MDIFTIILIATILIIVFVVSQLAVILFLLKENQRIGEELEELIFKIDLMLTDDVSQLFTTKEDD